MTDSHVPRRDFIKATGMATAGLVFVKPGSVYGTPANDAMTLGVIGCGGRGGAVGGAFIRAGARVVALADLFDDRLAQTRERFDKAGEAGGAPRLTDAQIFRGPESYRKLLATNVDAVLITSPPYYHPDHFEAAVEAKKHCYLEKPVATDVHGAKRIEKTGKKGAGKVSMAVGFQAHYAPAYEEMVRRVHAGAIGDIVTVQANYFTGDLRRKDAPGMSPGEARIRNWVFDKVLSGDILVEQNVHVLDILNWVLKSHPTDARGLAGKKARTDVDCSDHFVVAYTYPNGVHVGFESTQYKNSLSAITQRFLGSRGHAEANFFKGGVRIVGEEPWDAQVEDAYAPAVDRKVAAFVDGIRNGKLQDEVATGVESTLTAILGRTAAYTGRITAWDDLVKSNAKWDAKLDLDRLAVSSTQ